MSQITGQPSGEARRGLWSSLPRRGEILLCLPCCLVAQHGERTAQPPPSLETLIVRTNIPVRLFLVTRSRDSLICLEIKRSLFMRVHLASRELKSYRDRGGL